MPSARRNFIFAGEKKFCRRKVKFRRRKINFMKSYFKIDFLQMGYLTLFIPGWPGGQKRLGNLPWHPWILQCSDFSYDPEHETPISCVVLTLVKCWVPPPQVLEQCPDHSDHSQYTASRIVFKSSLKIFQK